MTDERLAEIAAKARCDKSGVPELLDEIRDLRFRNARLARILAEVCYQRDEAVRAALKPDAPLSYVIEEGWFVSSTG